MLACFSTEEREVALINLIIHGENGGSQIFARHQSKVGICLHHGHLHSEVLTHVEGPVLGEGGVKLHAPQALKVNSVHQY